MIRVIYIYDNVNADRQNCLMCKNAIKGNSHIVLENNELKHLKCFKNDCIKRSNREELYLMLKPFEEELSNE